MKKTCYVCDQQNHERKTCPAKKAICNYRNKVGQFSGVCRKRLSNRRTQGADSYSTAAANCESNLASISASAADNSTLVLCDETLNGISEKSLMNTGSSDCYVDNNLPKDTLLKSHPLLEK